jgi:hypothetical protein
MIMRALPSSVLLVTSLLLAGGARAQEPGQEQEQEQEQAPAEAEEGPTSLRSFLAGDWIDPQGEFWAPRRGSRTELSLFLGGEGSLGELGSLDEIPSIGGSTITAAGRYYPVDRLAIVVGSKGYLGVAEPAPGTTAETVVSPFFGLRWDLVREGRFSLLTDVTSGPALFLFADVLGALGAAWAIGAESSVAATLRYSLGPWTAELRTFAGGRVGTANEIGRPGFEVGPFSALYLGADVGVTWSFAGAREPKETSLARR